MILIKITILSSVVFGEMTILAGILSLLDEQCNFPKATDLTFAQKMATELKENPR